MSLIYSGESDSAVQCAYIETCKGEGSSKGKVAYRGERRLLLLLRALCPTSGSAVHAAGEVDFLFVCWMCL